MVLWKRYGRFNRLNTPVDNQVPWKKKVLRSLGYRSRIKKDSLEEKKIEGTWFRGDCLWERQKTKNFIWGQLKGSSQSVQCKYYNALPWGSFIEMVKHQCKCMGPIHFPAFVCIAYVDGEPGKKKTVFWGILSVFR